MVFLVFAGLGIAGLVMLVLLAFGIRVQKNNIWLLAYLLVLGYSVLISHLMESGHIYQFPHLIRTGTICGYLIVPTLYLYVRSTCYPGKVWRHAYFWLFVPSLFFMVDFLPFWQLPAAQKISLFEESMRSQQSLHAFSEGWISPKGFHFPFRLLWSFVWFTATVVVLYRNRGLLSPQTEAHNRWVYQFICGLTLLCLPFMLAHSIIIVFFYTQYTLTNFTVLLAIPLVAVGVYLMFFPRIVYGFVPGRPAIPYAPSPAVVMDEPEPKLPPALPAEHEDSPEVLAGYEAYKEQLLHYMTREKPFLQQGLTVHQLAEGSGIPTYIVSMLINRHLGQSFNSWVNAYRIEKFIELANAPDASSYTMESLGKAAGFGSRMTLIKAFKRQTGLTPSQYFRHPTSDEMPNLN